MNSTGIGDGVAIPHAQIERVSAPGIAASDPLHVIPACALGSAVAGALSMFFNCTLMAPHGGIFVLSVIGNPFGYFASLVIGSILGMFLLAMLKKPIKA